MTTEQKSAGTRGHDAKGRFTKGNPGNPNSKGRPPAVFSITELLRAEVAARPQVIKRWIALLESQDENVAGRMLVALAHRLDGMPRQALDVTHKEAQEQFDAKLAAKLAADDDNEDP